MKSWSRAAAGMEQPRFKTPASRDGFAWSSPPAPILYTSPQELHAGEAESIVLALEVRPDVLLLDEAEARRIAGLYDLPVTGIIGLLIEAKREGQLSSLREEMDRLREQGNFWIHDTLYRRALEAGKEV